MVAKGEEGGRNGPYGWRGVGDTGFQVWHGDKRYSIGNIGNGIV